MANLSFSGKIPLETHQVNTQLQVLLFQEDGVYLLYAPALDIVGSGNDANQAKASFWETLSEFFRYTINKGTLASELKRLGWSVKGSKKAPKVKAPDFKKLYQSNEQLQDIIANKNYSSFQEMVAIPAFA